MAKKKNEERVSFILEMGLKKKLKEIAEEKGFDLSKFLRNEVRKIILGAKK
jgi:hypothetical protein